jgi:hypothetical protein
MQPAKLRESLRDRTGTLYRLQQLQLVIRLGSCCHLCYKPKSRRIDSRFLNWPNPSSRTMALGSTQPLTEMSTRNLPGGRGGKGRKARNINNLKAICELTV